MKITEITKEELLNIYHNNSNRKACEILKITNSTLIKYLRQNNIKLKGSGNRNKKGKLVIKE
jgi:phage antirepressor YoqD-like protein